MSGLQIDTDTDGYISGFSIIETGGGFKFECDPPTTVCYYLYSYTRYQAIDPCNTTAVAEAETANAAAVVTLTGTLCQDPGLGYDWEYTGTSVTSTLRLCTYTKLVETSSLCTEIEAHCQAGGSNTPAAPTELENCDCGTLLDLVSSYPAFSVAAWQAAYALPDLASSYPAFSMAAWQAAYVLPDLVSSYGTLAFTNGDQTTKSYTTGGYGTLKVAVDLQFNGVSAAYYLVTLRAKASGNPDYEYVWTTHISVTAPATLTQTYNTNFSIGSDQTWTFESITVEDDLASCASGSAVSGSITVYSE